MELIDKKLVIDTIDEYYTATASLPQYVKDDIINTINALPTVNDGWISVSEKLPETDGIYLVWGSTFADTPQKVLRCNYYKKVFKADSGMGVKTKNVPHWMLLPTPPNK